MRRMVWLVVAACAAPDAPVVLRFTPEPGAPGSERYQCFGFDAAPLAGADLAGIAFARADGPVAVHHITLFASPSPFPEGPVDCLEMPDDAVPMNVWAPGGGDVVLADDVSLVIPDATTHLIVQTHALRGEDGPATERRIVLEPREPAPHRAGWLPLRAAVPVLQPRARAETTSTCTLDAPLHVVSTWPHMHRMGAEFHGLVDVVPWDFDLQRVYPVDVDLNADDVITTRCIWQNTSDAVVLPGPNISDEMCGQSLIAYPFDAARCR